MDWDGTERRQEHKDHDILIRIDQNLKNFLERCEKQCVDNAAHFDKHSKRITTLEKGYWIAVGVLAVIQVLLKFV